MKRLITTMLFGAPTRLNVCMADLLPRSIAARLAEWSLNVRLADMPDAITVKRQDIWPTEDVLLPNDGRRHAMAWEHLAMFGSVPAPHDLAPCLNSGACAHTSTVLRVRA